MFKHHFHSRRLRSNDNDLLPQMERIHWRDPYQNLLERSDEAPHKEHSGECKMAKSGRDLDAHALTGKLDTLRMENWAQQLWRERWNEFEGLAIRACKRCYCACFRCIARPRRTEELPLLPPMHNENRCPSSKWLSMQSLHVDRMQSLCIQSD